VEALPVDEAVEELLATAALCDEHQVARRDVGLMQRHHLEATPACGERGRESRPMDTKTSAFVGK